MGLILVIDDEQDVLDLIQDILQTDGHTVHAALNAPTALDLISKNKYGVIFSDVLMPGMSGLDLLKKLRGQRISSPVVFVSASDAEETLAKALEYGAADFISKPFAAADLSRLATKMVKISELI